MIAATCGLTTMSVSECEAVDVDAVDEVLLLVKRSISRGLLNVIVAEIYCITSLITLGSEILIYAV